jgi:oligopeptide transport system permease protein
MAKFLVRRFLGMFGVLFVVSLVTFFMMHAIPGGPFDKEKALPQSVIERLEAKYNLDDPLHVQYINYISDIAIPRIVEGPQTSTMEDYLINIPLPFGDDMSIGWMNFGPSYKSAGSRSVNDIFRQHLPISAQLGVAAIVVAMSIGIPLGIIAALRRNTVYDYTSMGIAILGVSVPVIVLGPLLRYVVGVELGWLPVSWGLEGYSTLEKMIMPAFALGFASSALLARLTRASLLQVLAEDYIRTARAKGLRERMVVFSHALRNSLIPVVTVLGPLLAALITGTFVAEQVFSIPGLGRYFVNSITNRDYPVMMGTILLYAAFLVLANMIVDIVYAMLDPRIRYD